MTPDPEYQGTALPGSFRPEEPPSPNEGLLDVDTGTYADSLSPADATSPDPLANTAAGAKPDSLSPGLLLNALWGTTDLTHQMCFMHRPDSGFMHLQAGSVAESLATAVEHSEAGDDVYFACAEYLSQASRKAGNAAGACAFWLDIDCGEQKATEGKGYANQDGGMAALRRFMIAAGLPDPTHIVDSGSGLHVYWALAKHLPAAEWKAAASQLKVLCKQLGFWADPSRTADIASVLRVPGTLNYKYKPPRHVVLIEAFDTLIDADAMVAAIDSAHAKFCIAPGTMATPIAEQPSATNHAPTRPIDLAALRSALGALDPDCDDYVWKLHRLAPLAAAAREHPDLADEMHALARNFSSGALRGQPSLKWSSPGATNGLTGEQVFETQWQRFYCQPHTGGRPVTLATIFHDSKKSGWAKRTDEFTDVSDWAQITASNDAGHVENAAPGEFVPQFSRLSPGHFPDHPLEGRGPLPSTLPNLRYLLMRYGIVVRYDVIKKKIRITIPGHAGSVDNADNVALTKIISLAVLNGLGTGQLPCYVDAIADENLYNPAAAWILSKPWDGIDRLSAVYDTLQTREDFPQSLKVVLIYRWLLSLVAAALKSSGFKGRGVLTLQGPQGIGKTSWVISLVDDPALRETLVKVDHHLDPSQKDSILGAIAHWIVEIGELDSSFRKDMARLKGVLTSDSDKIRRPYARTESEYQRRTVFMATVNEATFLVDHTGNSRWWTLPVVKVNFKHGIDMQQVFAQLAVDFHAGKQWWLTPEEDAQLAERNEHHRSLSAVEEQLLATLDLHPPEGCKKAKMTALKILQAAGIGKPSNPQCKDANAFLRRHVGEPKRIKGVNYWEVCLRDGGLDTDAPMAPVNWA